MKAMPKVSIVIPAYNAMNYLPQTVSSVMEQTYKDFEIVLVNDGSTDCIQEWVAAQNIPQIELISQENRGLAGARNTGIRHAQGSYIAILDADDLWEPTKLEKQVQILDADLEAALVYTWVSLVDEDGVSTGRFYKSHEEGKVWEPMLSVNIVGCGSVPLIRKSCLDRVGEFDENLRSFVEDWDLWLRMARLYPFKVIKEPLVYYRQRPDSASKNWEAMERSYQIVIQKNFRDRSLESASLRARCEAFVCLNLAWMALQGFNPDYSMARQYQQKALRFFPKIVLRWEFWRFCVASFLIRSFGGNGYRGIRSMLSLLRSRLSLRRV
jgi:glycosyltransferase involved in cell wall biosynthesis